MDYNPSTLSFAAIKYLPSISNPTNSRPVSRAATAVVPEMFLLSQILTRKLKNHTIRHMQKVFFKESRYAEN